MRPRLTVRANRDIGGDLMVLTFRAPKDYTARLDAIVATGHNGIATRTDALQDALGVWLLLEEQATNGAVP